jgi:hypothetical protein
LEPKDKLLHFFFATHIPGRCGEIGNISMKNPQRGLGIEIIQPFLTD